MKILLYCDYYKDASGYAKEARDIIPHFIKAGHEVRQVALHYDGLTANNKIFCYPTMMVGAGGHFAPEVLRRAILDFEPDIILSINDYFALPFIVPVISKPYKKPFKFIHWGVCDGEPLDRKSTHALTWVHHHINHSKYGKEVIGKSLKAYLNYHVPMDIDVVYPPTDLGKFKQLDNKDELKKKYGLQDKYVVLFLSRNQYRKNIPALLEAVKRISKVIPQIMVLTHSINTVSPDGRAEGYDLDGIVKYLDIEDKIAALTSKGMVILPQNLINMAYNLADVVCVPTMGEGFGLYLTEAMACGVPNICTDCSSVTELLNDDRGYLVKPAAYIWNGGTTKHAIVNSDDLANALFTLHNDKKLRELYIKNGKKFVKDLTPEKISKKLLEIFSRVIKEDKMPIALEK